MEKSQVKINHLGFIVDGNRRWAKEKGLATIKGHQKGLEVVESTIEYLAKNNSVNFASFYVFSTENWNRSKEEVSYLMELLIKGVLSLAKKMKKNNIKCVILGSEKNVPEDVLKSLKKAEEITKKCTKMTVAICFNYGGKQEIVDAATKLAKKGEEITVESIEKNLYRPEIPACDMIVRTSGEERISGFMLWRAAYSELMFVKKYWPDFTNEDIEKVLDEYQTRNRRFGK